MSIKNAYYKVRDLNLKEAIEIPKYLFGYNIHQDYKKKRQAIRNSEDNLGKKVLKLSGNYALEGFRQVVRYTPLALEGMTIYFGVTEDLSALLYLPVPVGMRCLEQAVVYTPRFLKGFEEFSKNVDNINKVFERIGKDFERRNIRIEDAVDILLQSGGYRKLWNITLIKDPYEVLGINKNASKEEIQKAYRSMAKECHPDVNKGDEEKTKEFIRVAKAYFQLTGQYHQL